jgi:hypothetical protein
MMVILVRGQQSRLRAHGIGHLPRHILVVIPALSRDDDEDGGCSQPNRRSPLVIAAVAI